MGNIVKRLKIFVDHLEKSVRQVEIEIGVSNGTLSRPFKTGKGITTDTLEKFVAQYDELNLVWLFKEKGNMTLPIAEQVDSNLGFDPSQKKFLQETIESTIKDSQKHYRQDLKDTQKLLEMEKEIESLGKQLKEFKSASD